MRYWLRSLLIIVCFSTSYGALAQTIKFSGKVLNSKNEAIPGASIKLDGQAGGTTSDLEGRFILNLSPGKKYSIQVSAVGYETKLIDDIEAVAGQTNELDIVLNVKAQMGDSVVVTARPLTARRETVNSLIAFQKNTNTVASVISAETIRRSPDRNTGEVLKRTPGASIQEGRFIIVRGLADRYNQAMLNGVLLSSTEPDRKTFSFDLIPSSMIDNLVINKAFVPEYPGEWAGGLIQVNTKDIPTRGFFNVQVGTGFNTQTTGKKFLKEADGGSLDWLGMEDGKRELPGAYTTKGGFDALTPAQKTEIGKGLRNSWMPTEYSAPLNASFQANGGFNTNLFGKKIGGTIGVVYSKNNRYIEQENVSNSLASNIFSQNYDFNDDRYVRDISWGALGSVTMQLNSLNKISVKSIFNVNAPISVTSRSGQDFTRGEELRGTEFSFKQNTFFNGQVSGEHKIALPVTFKWYGSFNILDGYIPDQRRILYSRTTGTSDPYRAVISNTLSQQSGSRIYQNLNDYIYTGGGDLSYSFNLFDQRQTIKGGYMIQVRDRLYDAKLFANYLPTDNDALRRLPANSIFNIENFGDGNSSSNLFGFDAIKGNNFRYLANTILNAGFLQFDNQFNDAIRVVWGLRVENYDQLVGSVRASDPRHTHSEVLDFLPGINFTYKLNSKTNIRISGSQTVIRPELRELSFLNLYDFELNASVQGRPTLERTKVTNVDLRYELYPAPGQVLTAGVFYKYFDKPIEQIYNEGSGGASTFSYQNPEKAVSYGAEVEFRKKLDFIGGMKNFTLQANAAYIKSKITDAGFSIDRPLQGQSPYVVNIGLLYDLEKAGLNMTLLYNQIGHRIYLVGDLTAGAGSPDIYEAPRPVFDFQVSKKLLDQRGELKLNVSDILNKTQYFYQNAGGKTSLQKGEDAYRFTRRFGTTFSLTFNYSFTKA